MSARCRHSDQEYGRIDFLINNAAIGPGDSFEMPYEAWQTQWNATLNTNLMSAVNMTPCSVPHMKKQGAGKICNIASRSAFRGETEYMVYAASKAAMVNLTRCTARALAKKNILAYAVALDSLVREWDLKALRAMAMKSGLKYLQGKSGRHRMLQMLFSYLPRISPITSQDRPST